MDYSQAKQQKRSLLDDLDHLGIDFESVSIAPRRDRGCKIVIRLKDVFSANKLKDYLPSSKLDVLDIRIATGRRYLS